MFDFPWSSKKKTPAQLKAEARKKAREKKLEEAREKAAERKKRAAKARELARKKALARRKALLELKKAKMKALAKKKADTKKKAQEKKELAAKRKALAKIKAAQRRAIAKNRAEIRRALAKQKNKGKKPARRKTAARKALVSKRTVNGRSGPKIPFNAYEGNKPYIFVSYAHSNMKTVFNIIEKLNKSGYHIWYDEGIEPGQEWPEIVGKKIIKCSQFLVFMSPEAIRSRNVRNEVNLAFSEKRDIVVVYLADTNLTSGMKLQIGTVHFINRFKIEADKFFEKLRGALIKT